MLNRLVTLHITPLLLLAPPVTFAQPPAKPIAFYVIWDNGGEPISHTYMNSRDWASRQLNLGLYDRGVPKGVVVHGPKKLVEPHAHVNGEVTLIGTADTLGFPSVRFREVRNEKEYLLRVDEIQSEYQIREANESGGELSLLGPPERRQIVYGRNWLKPKTIDEVEYIRGTKVTRHRSVKDEDGNRVTVAATSVDQRFVRRANGILIEGMIPAVFELPIETITRPASFRDDDRTYLINVADIPIRQRETLWEQRAVIGGTRLQQRDHEDDVAFSARRAWEEMRQDLERAAYFDVDRGWASFKFRNESSPIRAVGELTVLPGTELSLGLKRLGRVPSRLHLVEHDDEVASLHITSRIPQPALKVLKAALDTVRPRFPAKGFFQMVDDTIDGRVFELLLNIRADSEHGMAGIGAIRTGKDVPVDDGDQFAFVSALPELQAKRVPGLTDRTFVRISLDTVRALKATHLPEWEFVEVPQYAFLWADAGALWFALGGENAWKVLDAELSDERRNDEELRSQTHLLQCRVNLELAPEDESEQSVLRSYLKTFEQTYVKWYLERFFQVTAFGNRLALPNMNEVNVKYIFPQVLTGRPSRAEFTLDNVGNGLCVKLVADHSLALCYFGRGALNTNIGYRARRMAIRRNANQ